MKIQKTLVCFTASYPYGTRETYFENELQYLSGSFEKIIIIPTYNPYNSSVKRDTPKNVEVYDITLKQGFYRVLDFIRCFRIREFHLREFFHRKVFLNWGRTRKWLLSILSYGQSYRAFIAHQFDPENVILYSYWTGKSFFLEKSLKKFKKIIRMHGGDFYEERNNGYLPLQKELYNVADLLLPISKDIYTRLVDNYEVENSKVVLSYLGTSNTTVSNRIKDKSVIQFISCSNVYPLKRIHLIYEILKCLDSDSQVSWTHIGAGSSLSELKHNLSKDIRPNIQVHFLGQLSQKQLMDVYTNNYFDFFINTSEYEGLPVSIMEAFSFGIPAIATNVGGTSEIVNNDNGILIDRDFVPQEVAIHIEQILGFGIEGYRKNAFQTWESLFDADQNYQKLIIDIRKSIL